MAKKKKHIQRVAIKTFGAGKYADSISCGYMPGSLLKRRAKNIRHQNLLLVVILEGIGRFIDNYERQYEIKPGTVIIRYPDVFPYCLERFRNKPWLEYYIRIPDCITELLTGSGLLEKDNYCFDTELTAKLLSDFELLFKIISSPTPADTVQAFAKAQNIVAELLQHKNGDEYKHNSGLIEQAREILEKDLEENISIPTLAKQLGVGYESFRKKFKAHTGYSPKSYRIGKKIETAKNLLSNPELGVKQIAFMTGYPDHIKFVKQFKKHTCITPTEFRRKLE